MCVSVSLKCQLCKYDMPKSEYIYADLQQVTKHNSSILHSQLFDSNDFQILDSIHKSCEMFMI